jgi:hypothetical protein
MKLSLFESENCKSSCNNFFFNASVCQK